MTTKKSTKMFNSLLTLAGSRLTYFVVIIKGAILKWCDKGIKSVSTLLCEWILAKEGGTRRAQYRDKFPVEMTLF